MAEKLSPITTKGDLIIGDNSGNTMRLPVGTDTHVLTLDSSVTGGIKWAAGAGGFTNLTQFVSQTAHRLFYSDASGDVQELAYGSSGQFLKSNGLTSTPSWDSPAGAGTVTDFIFTDGNGFDGTVSLSTSTPTLSLTTTVTDDHVMFSNSGAIAGSAGFTYDGDAVTITESGLGETHSDTKGLILKTTTVTTTDGTWEAPPSIVFSYNGWDDDSDVNKTQEMLISAGTYDFDANDNAYPYITFKGSIDGAAYTEAMRVYANGTVTIGHNSNHDTLGTNMPGEDGLSIWTNNASAFRSALAISNINGGIFYVYNTGVVSVQPFNSFQVGINGNTTISSTNFTVDGGTTGLTMIEQITPSAIFK